MAAQVQIARIARLRKLDEHIIKSLVRQKTQKPFLGVFGTEHINVLQLNIALDELN
jgi:K+-transporting ATPase ATPase C chain